MSRALITGAVLGAGLLSGGLLMQSGAWKEAAGASTGSPRLYDQVVARLLHDYVDTLRPDDLNRKAAFGLVGELDGYSALLSPDRANRLHETTTGRYAGVGIEIDLRDGDVTVIAPLAGTPADSAGVLPGDRVMTIDTTSTAGLTMDEVERAMRGPIGSRVKLGIERDNEDALRVFELTRRIIEVHPVQRIAMLPQRTGYLELTSFSERAAAEVRRAIDSLREQGAASLILDLRGNPGGLLEQGIAVAELFLDPGKSIASTRGRVPDANRTFADRSPQVWPTVPMVVAVDSGTASAAEIVAGALRDNDRAIIIGSPTYGKGSAQSLIPIQGGYALKLTTARWMTPDGRSIQRDSAGGRGGITPDVVVRQTLRPDSALALRRRGVAPPDPVIDRSLALLRGVSTPAALLARVPKKKP